MENSADDAAYNKCAKNIVCINGVFNNYCLNFYISWLFGIVVFWNLLLCFADYGIIIIINKLCTDDVIWTVCFDFSSTDIICFI